MIDDKAVMDIRSSLQFMCMIDRLYDTFCATVTLDNNQAFTMSLMKWFEAHCTAETFVKPLQYLMHRFLSEVCSCFMALL
jgi:hypothetical protein